MGEVIDIHFLKECLVYDPISGQLRWSSLRPRTHFDSERSEKTWHKRFAGKVAGERDYKGYLVFAVKWRGKKRTLKVHRVVWALSHGAWPKEQVDHVDGNKSNNRLDNLREASAQENSWNRGVRADNSTGVKGVHRTKNRYRAQIKRDGRIEFLGSFERLEDAAMAYQQAANREHGEFANIGR